jgi:hypothetical protein
VRSTSALGWSFILSTTLLILCRLWLNYYEDRLLPIGPGDRDLTVVVFHACAAISMVSIIGFLIETTLHLHRTNAGE